MWAIRATLTNGETHYLAKSYGNADEAAAFLLDFQQRKGDFAGDWLDTRHATSIARAHIVEVQVVPLRD